MYLSYNVKKIYYEYVKTTRKSLDNVENVHKVSKGSVNT